MPKKVVIILDSDSDDDLDFICSIPNKKKSNDIEIIEEFSPKKPKSRRSLTGTKRKRSDNSLNKSKNVKKRKLNHSTSSNIPKFHLPAIKSNINHKKSSNNLNNNTSYDLWVDKYKPKLENELAVRKQKVSEVKKWLENSLLHLPLGTPNTQRMLILTGPSGGCKTAMIQVLCKSLGAEVCEWIDPALYLWKDADNNISVPYSSRMETFRSFMLRSERYESIQINTKLKSSKQLKHKKEPIVQSQYLQHKKVLLLEQLPYIHDDKQKIEFNNTINDFLISSRFPMVLIMSDDTFGGNSLYKLLGSSILASPFVNIININAVTTSTITRILKSICQKEKIQLSIDIINKLTERASGDLRNAISSLQFYCKNIKPSTKPVIFKRSSQLSQNSNEEENDDNELLGGMDSNFSFYHCIAKVCHHKRESDSNPLQDINNEYYKDPLTFVPEEVFKSVQVAPWLFNLYVHENYPTFFNDINEIAIAAEYLSDSDIIDAELNYPYRNERSITSYIDSIASRGILYHNNSPPIGKFVSIYKPLYFQVNYKQRDIQKLVDYLFIQGSSPTELRSQTALLSSNRILFIDVLPLLFKIITGIKNDSFISLTEGQLSGLRLLSTFSTKYRRSIMNKNEVDEGLINEATLIKTLTQKCYTQHIKKQYNNNNNTNDNQGEVNLLLKIGGKFNEELLLDDIEDYND